MERGVCSFSLHSDGVSVEFISRVENYDLGWNTSSTLVPGQGKKTRHRAKSAMS